MQIGSGSCEKNNRKLVSYKGFKNWYRPDEIDHFYNKADVIEASESCNDAPNTSRDSFAPTTIIIFDETLLAKVRKTSPIAAGLAEIVAKLANF